MTESKPPGHWSELNDATVIEAMLKNADSEHWGRCNEFIRYYIEKHFQNLPLELRAETVQEIMLSVHKGLLTFRHQSKFTTWLVSIARNRAIDTLRRQADIAQWEMYIEDPTEGHEEGAETSTKNMSGTPEEVALTNERVRETFAAIEEFLQMHAKPERNRRILEMTLRDGYSQEETAHQLGVPAPVVGYVVRSARSYLRQQLTRTPESNE